MAEAKNLSTNKVAQPSITSMPNQTNSELNHWLSLGARNTAENPLARSSSAALEETITPLQTAACDPSQLARSSSVPMEPGQWMLRHKEMRALRRLEAKKRVAERRAEEAAGSSLLEVTGASSTAIYKFKAEGYLSVSTAPNGAQNAKGITNSFDAVLVERDIIKPVLTSSKRVKASNDMTEDNDGEEVAKAKMPRVRTIGAGGRMIEGVLHRYHQGHVSIRCVCHGSFYSPTEFVKHAGGNEVANPLRHITVVCSPPSDYSNSGGSVAPLHW